MSVSYDAEHHRYAIDSRPVPGVTHTIEAVYRQFDGVASDDLLRRRALGLAVHLGCELYDEGTLDYAALHPEVRPGVDAYIRLRQTLGFVPVRKESIVASTIYRFAGRLDRVGHFRADPATLVIIDLKFVRQLSPATALQTAAYAQAEYETHGVLPGRRFAAQLGTDGKPRIKEYVAREGHSFGDDFAAFVNVLGAAVFGWNSGLMKGGI